MKTFVLGALSLLACSPVARDLGGLACDNGACAEGYSCDTDANVCVTTGEACGDEGRTSACPSNTVRECTGGVWSDCTPYGGECTPGSTQCDTGSLIECDGRGYVKQSTPCGAPGCNDMVAPQRCNACVPGTTSCNVLLFVTCSSEGLVASQENCATASACAGAGTCDPALGCDVVNQAADDTPCDEGVGLNGDWCDSSCQSGVCTTTQPDCDDGFDCTVDSCNMGTGCVNAPQPVDTPCRGSTASFCDSTCDGGTVCRNSGFPRDCDDGNRCTVDNCNTGDGSCSYTVNTAAGVVCRAADGPCDLAETCDGSSPDCPPDLMRGSTSTCGPNTGPCDAATCTGTDAACPNNGFSPAGTPCGDATNSTCTDPNDCDGSGNCQPHNVNNGTSCGDCSAGPVCDTGGCQAGVCPDRCDGSSAALMCNTVGDCATCRECLQVTCAGGTPATDEHQACADMSDGTNWGSGLPCEAVSCAEGAGGGDAQGQAIGDDCYAADTTAAGAATVNITYIFNTASSSGTAFNIWMRNAADGSWDAGEFYDCSLTNVNGGGTYQFSFTELDLDNVNRHGGGCGNFNNTGIYCWMAVDGDTDSGNQYQSVNLDQGSHSLTCSITVDNGDGGNEDAGFDGIIFTTDLAYVPAENDGPTACGDSDQTFTAGACADAGNNWGPNLAPSPGIPNRCGTGAQVADNTPCTAGVCCSGNCQATCP